MHYSIQATYLYLISFTTLLDWPLPNHLFCSLYLSLVLPTLTFCRNFSTLHPAICIPFRLSVHDFILFFHWCVCVYAVVEVDLLPINCCTPLLYSASANPHQHQFTRYHRRWLADNVQKEEEESCKQWLLQSSPDTKSNLLKAVSGTEWMYRRGALERGRRVSVPAVCCVCVSAYT